MENSLHPLEALPVTAVAEWVAQVEVLPLLRQRLDAYIARTGDKIDILRFRATSILRPKSLALSELIACKITINELFGDTGLAASLDELVEWGAVTHPKDLVKLGLVEGDVLGPFSSAARHARLSMTTLHAAFPEETKRFMRDEFSLTPLVIMAKHAIYLRPSDFNALALRFDGTVMRKEPLLKEMRKHVSNLFSLYPYEEWHREAGLDDNYLGILFGIIDKRQVEMLHKKIWPH